MTVTNTGAQPLTISGLTLTGAAAGFAITADSCSGHTLAFGQACTIGARFSPVSAGAAEAGIALSDNEPSPSSISLTGNGVAPEPVVTAPAVRAPSVSDLKQSARLWRTGAAAARISSRAAVRAPALGTTFSFALSESAAVRFVFLEPGAGRLVGRTCAAPTRRNAGRRRCTRALTAGTLAFAGHAGTNRVRFDGVISRRVKLRPGSYSLQVEREHIRGTFGRRRSTSRSREAQHRRGCGVRNSTAGAGRARYAAASVSSTKHRHRPRRCLPGHPCCRPCASPAARGTCRSGAALLHSIFEDSGRNHAFPEVALHGALWAYGFYERRGAVSRMFTYRYFYRP